MRWQPTPTDSGARRFRTGREEGDDPTEIGSTVAAQPETRRVVSQPALSSQSEPMRRDPTAADAPALQDVLDALDDPDCRAIIEHLEAPMSATELSEACEIPRSTIYRKLELLSEASLLEERIEIRTDGHHTTLYAVAFDAVRIDLNADRSLDVAIKRREESPDERLRALWSEVRKET